jgi:hypothetical protein
MSYFPVYADFRERVDPRFTWTRASSGLLLGANGLWRESPANTPRRQRAEDGTALGVLVEPSGVNDGRNPRGEGLVAGSPGTLPTHWAQPTAVAGVDRTLGYATIGGLTVPTYRYHGTPTATTAFTIEFEERASAPSATPSQARMCQALVGIVAGGLTNISGVNLRALSLNAAGAPVTSGTHTGPDVRALLGSNLRRITQPFTTSSDAATEKTVHGIQIAMTDGLPVDITLALYAPWNYPGSIVQTAPLPAVGSLTASTRAADTGTTALADWGMQPTPAGTFLLAFRAPAGAALPASELIAEIIGTNTENRVRLRYTSGASLFVDLVTGNTIQGSLASEGGPLQPATDYVAAVTWEPGAMALSLNGAAVVSTSAALMPSLLTMRMIGSGQTVERIAFRPFRTPDADLRALTRQGAIA